MRIAPTMSAEASNTDMNTDLKAISHTSLDWKDCVLSSLPGSQILTLIVFKEQAGSRSECFLPGHLVLSGVVIMVLLWENESGTKWGY